jgi:hypothetical protein
LYPACSLSFQIEEEEKKLQAAIEAAENLFTKVNSEMKDMETKSKQFEELEERFVFSSPCHIRFRASGIMLLLLQSIYRKKDAISNQVLLLVGVSMHTLH